MDEPTPPQDNRDESRLLAQGMRYASVALQFAGTLLVLAYVGYRIDERYRSSPWGILAGLLVGMTVGTWSLLRQTQKLDKMK